jgi:eukaryotic-like serine/threonine-protein kinase
MTYTPRIMSPDHGRTGTRLGAYTITGTLGAGGMGEVYRARDTRLDRDVAVKVLPATFAADPEWLARFEREAKSVAQLSHPNILGIFDFGREPATGAGHGVTYAVMELLEGETLRERLARGPIPPRKAIDFSIQIASGLAAAHGKGIVHRDLKPDNLFITHDDRLKILDFGLAKATLPAASDVTGAGVATAAGLVMGTVGYMAPEQVRGLAVDYRSDIFAFGAVLYEMVAGRRAFGGDSPADTISAILNSDPPELDINGGGTPPALERIIRRCLEKKPDLRFQSAQDLAFALDTLSSRATGPTAAAAPAPITQRGVSTTLPWVVAAAAMTVAAAVWALTGRAPAPEAPWQVFTPITDMAGVETTPSLSPDGTMVAYATRAHGSWDIYAQRVGGRLPVPIAADPNHDESGPAFSPDGQRVAFHRAGGAGAIFVASASGDAARRLTDFGFHPTWSPDSRQIAFTTEEISDPYSRFGDSALWIVDVAGGEPRHVEGAGDAAQAAWSPSGGRIAYWSNTGGQRDLYTIPATGGTRVAVTSDAPLDWSPAWSPDGRYLYFASDRGGSMNLWRTAIDERSGAVPGAPEPVTTGVQAAAEMPAFSSDGARLAFRSRVSATNPIAIPFDPVTLRAGTPTVLTNSNTSRRPSSVSRDGRWLALANLGEPQEDLFISALDGSGMRRITDDAARDRIPAWSADGQSLYFYSNRGGGWAIWSIGVDGGGLRQIASRPSGVLYPLVSPDGQWLVASGATGSYGAFLSSVKPSGSPDENVEGLAGTDGFFATSWSPDGTKLAGYFATPSNMPDGLGIYDLKTRTFLHRFDGATQYAVWLPDSRRVCYFTLAGGELMVLDTETGQARKVDVRLPLPDGGDAIALAPDGRTLFYGGRREEADIWIVERAPVR